MVQDILDWLRKQGAGLRTYSEFQERLMKLAQIDHGQFALCSLLAVLANRFELEFNGNPLPATVANTAIVKLVEVVERAVMYPALSAAAQIELLNNIAQMELG